MAGPPKFHCAICLCSFDSKASLSQHALDHPDTIPKMHNCAICNWTFDDLLALEAHTIQAEHGTALLAAVNSPSGGLNSLNGASAKQYACDRCPNTFRTQQEYIAHRSFPNGPCCDHKRKTPPKQRYVDMNDSKPKPKPSVNKVLDYDDSSDTPSDLSVNDIYCGVCKEAFPTQAMFNRHFLGCSGQVSRSKNVLAAQRSKVPSVDAQSSGAHHSPVSPIQARYTINVRVPVPQLPQTLAQTTQPMPLQVIKMNVGQPIPRNQHTCESAPPHSDSSRPPAPTKSSVTSTSTSSTSVCGINGCERTYQSIQGLKVHQTDIHGVGGQVLDLYGKNSWMLSQQTREQLKAKGVIRQSPSASRGSLKGRGRGGRAAPVSTRPRSLPPALVQHTPARHSPSQHGLSAHHTSAYRTPAQDAPARALASLPTSQNMGGPPEMEQAKFIHGKILRLLLQSDIFIHHDGKLTVSGINWTRIGVARQPDCVTMFDQMCHLPKVLQGIEYIPPPKTFKAEYEVQYPVPDFKHSPERNRAHPGLEVVAISCNKIILANGCREVVKVAAVDVSTCRILMNNLVCTDPNAQVANWRTSETGLSSFVDMEKARKSGYKIFKGWATARSALWKFIDKETIIVSTLR